MPSVTSFIIVTKAHIVLLDQELQTQIPTGVRGDKPNVGSNWSPLKAATVAQLHPTVPVPVEKKAKG